MPGRFLTFMVIPHSEDHVREFNLSRKVLVGMAAAAVLGVVSLGLLAFGYVTQAGEDVSSLELRTENEELVRHLDRLRDQLSSLRSTVDELTETDRRMRAYTSLSEPGPDVRKMGIGGFGESVAPWEERVSPEHGQLLVETYTDVEQLVREARFLQASFDSVLAALARDETIRRHTPSIFPVGGEGWYSSTFGYRDDPFTGQRTFHAGLDIAGRVGTPVLATADGVVQEVGTDGRLGHYVTIQHKGGLRTLYGHLESLSAVVKGRRVVRGEEIGRMGNSGRTTATHLHYMVVLNGRPADPSKFIFDGQNRGVF